MADYKGLNIKFQGDTTDAAKALHILSSEARAAEGNLQGIQNALKNTATNGDALNAALKGMQSNQLGKQYEAAQQKVVAYGKSLDELSKKLATQQQKLVANRDALESMPAKYDALASSAASSFERVAAAQAALDDAKQRVAFAGTNSSWAQALRDQSEAQAELNAAIAAGDEDFKQLSATYGTLEGAVNSSEESIRSLGSSIEETNQRILTQESTARALQQQYEMMAASAAASQTNLGKFGSHATEAGNSLKSMGDALSSVGDKMTLVSGIAAMTFGRNIVSSTEEFGNAIAQLGGYLEIGGDQLKGMSDDALKWGKETQFSATEAANAMNELAKGGMTQAQIQGGAMKATMELAAAGSLDMAQAASVAVQAIKTFGLDAKDASQVADALAGAANKSTAEVTELANGFKYVGGWASMANWNINDVSGALALLSDHGLQSEMAGTALRNVMQRLAAPTDTAAKLMEQYGFSVRDSSGQMVDAVEVVKRLNDTFGQLGDEEKQNVLNDIFGARALPAAIALMDEGSDKLQEYIDSTTEVGYAGEMAKNRMGDLGWALEMLRGEAETAAVNFGQALAPTIIEVAHAIEGALTWFNSLDDATKQFIAKAALMAVATGPVVSIVGHLASGIGGLISTVGTGATTIANFSKLMAGGGDAVKLFAVAAAMAQTPMAGTVDGITQVAEKAATMTTALETAGMALKGGIVVAGVAFMVEQLKSLADEFALVGEATRDVDDIAREAMVSVANAGDAAESSGAKLVSYGQALNTMNESLKQSADFNKSVSESLKEMEGNISSAESYARTIKELYSVGSLSAAQQEQLSQAVEAYNKVTGAAVKVTDEMRGTLNMMPQDIDRVTEAYARQQQTKVYTELMSEALKEQIRTQKDAEKATKETQSAFGNWQNVVTTAANSFTGFGQIMNIVNYGKATIGLQGVSNASKDAAFSVDFFREAAEKAGATTEQYQAFLQQLFPELNNTGDAAQQAGNAIRQAAQEAAQAQREANQQIISEQQRAYDAEYKAAQKAYDAEYKAAQKAYDNEYKALQKQLDKEYKAQQKAYDAAYKQRQKELDKQYDAYKKQLDAEEAALKKSLDAKASAYKKQLDSELATLKKANDKRLKEQKKADEAETKAFKAETDKRVAALQAEYKERLKALELQYGGSDIDSQIKSLKDQTKAEQAEIKRRSQEEKKAELQKAVDQAKTRRARADAEKKLNDYLAEIAQEQRENDREVQIERLEEQKSALKDELAAKKAALKEEYDARIEALKEQRAAELEVIKDANDQEYETLKEQLDGVYQARKEANDARLEQIKEANQLEIDNLKEHHSLLLENMKEQHSTELEQLKEQQSEQLEAIKEGQQAQLDNLKEAQQAELDALKESQQAQLEALKESQQQQLEALRASLEAQVNELTAKANEAASIADAKGKEIADSMQKNAKDGVWRNKSEMDKLPYNTSAVLKVNEGNVNSSMQRTKSDMGTGGRDSGVAFAQNLGAQSGTVNTNANQLAEHAKNPLGAVPSAAGQFGVGTGSSFASGIGQGGVTAQTQASNIARGVSSALKQPADNSGTWGNDMMRNFNNAIVDFWNNTLLRNVESIAQNIANLLGHSTPKEGPLKGDDQWFYHMMQNLDSGMQRGIPELMGTVGGLAQSIADGMDVQPDIDVVGNLIESMQAEETALANQSRRMADIVREEFDPYASANYKVGYDAKPMVQAFASGVTEALRSGVPQQAGVTIVMNNVRFANDMDVDRFSERVTARMAAANRRGW